MLLTLLQKEHTAVTDLVMTYTWNPLKGFFKGVTTTFEILGYSRAAAELARLGYYEEAKGCMMQIAKLKK